MDIEFNLLLNNQGRCITNEYILHINIYYVKCFVQYIFAVTDLLQTPLIPKLRCSTLQKSCALGVRNHFF